MGRKSNEQIIKEQKVVIDKLFKAYSFLLCAAVVFLYSLHNFTINYSGIELNLMYLLFPIVYFMSNVTTKEIGYRCGVKAVIISTITLFFFVSFSDFFVSGSFNIVHSLSITFAYAVSQAVNLSIYYYLLVNTRLPIATVIINYVFSLLIYNMICMLFSYNMAFTDTFWLEYILLVLFQSSLSIVLSILDGIVERGID